jgi:hypothetical protein
MKSAEPWSAAGDPGPGIPAAAAAQPDRPAAWEPDEQDGAVLGEAAGAGDGREMPSSGGLSRADRSGPDGGSAVASDTPGAGQIPSALEKAGGDPAGADGLGGGSGRSADAPLERTQADGGPREQRQLHPLPLGLVELYGFLAVLIVLVPEWMASGALFGFREGREGLELPSPSAAWRRLPELRLASLNLAELRQLAQRMRLRGYGSLSRSALSSRLLKRLRSRP